MLINKTVLMSGAEYFGDQFAINAYMDSAVPVNLQAAIAEHATIQNAFETAGIKVIKVPAPEGCQDGVYTANWGLCRGNKVVLSYLPNKRRAEQPFAEKVLADYGLEVVRPPFRFSGQGDALPCGNLLFVGSQYRTDPAVHEFLGYELDYQIISLQTVPLIDSAGQVVINEVTGWPDSFFYDLDLALAVLRPDLIAWCPEAFVPESQAKLRDLEINKIEVSLEEARAGFGCNLVSTGETVIMSAHAPNFSASLQNQGFKIITPEIKELAKGGGFIRCTSLTLDND